MTALLPGRAARARRTVRSPRLTPVLWAVAGAWALLLVADLTGLGHALMHGGGLAPVALLTTAAWWAVMSLAMMGPATLPMMRYVAMNTLAPRRTVPRFLLAYLGVWVLVGVLVDLALAAAADGGPAWLAGHPVALPVTALVLAAAWQFGPTKRRSLRACRSAVFVPAVGRRGDRGALRLGVRHGVACVGTCGPMMLVMATAPGAHLVWMAALAGLIWAEKARGLGRRLAVPTAAAFLAVAGLLVVLSVVGPAPTGGGVHSHMGDMDMTSMDMTG